VTQLRDLIEMIAEIGYRFDDHHLGSCILWNLEFISFMIIFYLINDNIIGIGIASN
jgi:hypothetical protein